MTPDDLRRLMRYLEEQVRLADPAERSIAFEVPSEEDMLSGGLHPDGGRQILAAPWPEFCDPGDTPDQVLRYARDVVIEYIRKRFQL